MVRRIASPPGTSPTPVRPSLSVTIAMLRVKKGPCAPLRLSSMLSCPATGTTSTRATVGVRPVGIGVLAVLSGVGSGDLVDQGGELGELGLGEVRQRRADPAAVAADRGEAGLDDGDRVALGPVPDVEVREDELVEH